MGASFLLFANKEGVVCGGSADKTIFQLSKKEPVAIAVSPVSPIPWAEIVENYRRKGEPQHQSDFVHYAKDFESYLATVPAKAEWRNLGSDETKLVFMGYGTKDIYPSVYEVNVTLDEESKVLKFGKDESKQISHKTVVYWSSIGNFDCVEMMFQGATTPMTQLMVAKVQALYEAYTARVKSQFEGTEYEQMVDERIAEFDARKQAEKIVRTAVAEMHRRLKVGVDSFSIEDLVTAVETVIDANLRLMHLQSGGKETLCQTREIAVITRVEGLTWIKHSLFAI